MNALDRRRVLLIATVDAHILAFHLPVMRWLQEQGFEVHVAANGTAALPHCDQRFNLPFQRSPYSLANLGVYGALKKLIHENNYSLIHCHTPVGGLLGRLAARSARKRGTQVFYTAHGFHFCQGAPLLNWLLYYPAERFLARFTDCLITITEEDFSLATRHHFPAARIEHVPGVGVDADTFIPIAQADRQARRESLGYAEDELLLVYAAEFNANKNQAMLIRALAAATAATPRLRLLLAGEGARLESCRKLADDLKVARQVEFLGHCQDLPALLPLCDIAVASSLREGLPVNVMEAMSCGLPVVAADNRGHRELVIDGKTGFLVPPDDPMAMAEKISWLAANTEARKAMGDVGRNRILNHFSLPIATQAMTRIYASQLGLPGQVPLNLAETAAAAPVRILQVVTTLNRGGLETMLMNHYRVMDRSRIQFDFMVHREEPGAFEAEVLALGGRIHRMPAIVSRNIFKYIHTLSAFFTNYPEYRIVHSHLDTLSTLVLRAAKRAGVPCRIAHSHSTHLKTDTKAVGRWLSRTGLKNQCTHQLACSELAGDWLFGKGVRRQGKLTLFRNAIDISQFAFSLATRQRLRQALGFLENALVIGHVGRFDQYKNQTFLIDLFHALHQRQPNAALLLVGDGPLRPTMEQKVRDLSLSDAVQFLGVRSDIPDLLQAMDVFVFPSLFEGLGIVAIEAQTSGIPCIVSNTVPGECDVTGNVRFLSLSAGPDAWAVEILKAHRAERLADAVQRVAQAGYDVQVNARWLTGFYLDEVKKHPGHPA